MTKIFKYLSILTFLLLLNNDVYCQKLNTSDYIKKYKNLAIKEMKKYHIPASIILAQGILESGNGNSRLARNGKNHFGIKCHNNWDGRTIKWNDDSKRECFRRYGSVADSYRDHSEFLSSRGHYSDLFKLHLTDYKNWAKGLQKAGYATNNKYSNLLIRIIEDNNLNALDDPQLFANDLPVNQVLPTSEDDFEPIQLGGADRPLYTNNGVKFIFAEEGDSFATIARDLNIYSWQIYKYNELTKDQNIQKGQMLYIEKKKRRAGQKYHQVKSNESLYSISQLYGIQLKVLCKRNKLDIEDSISSGQQLRLD